MRLLLVTIMLLACGCICHAGDKLAADPTSRKSAAPDAPLVVSTNELTRILLNATNLPYIAAARNLYVKHTVLLNHGGRLKARFDLVSAFSTKYELVSKLAECIANCPVKARKQPDNSYLYTNEAKQTFKIRVIHDECDASHFQGVYYITGEKFFVKLKALLHVESRPDRDGGIEYAARIYASSDSFIFNLLTRAPFMKSYLADEVATVVTKFDEVYDELLTDPESELKKLMQYRDPAGSIYFSDEEIEMARKFTDKLLRDRTTIEPESVSSERFDRITGYP